jgi:hypothetical protein
MIDLHLATDNYKLIAGYVKIEAECQNTNTWYNVYIEEAAIEFALDIKDGELVNYCSKEDDNATDGICTAAQNIYDRFLTGTTTYDVFKERQKVIGYKFITESGKDCNVIIPWIESDAEAEQWRLKHNHKSYKTVLA